MPSIASKAGGQGPVGGAVPVTGSYTPADNTPTPTTAIIVSNFGMIFDVAGGNWDIHRSTLVAGAADMTERLMPAAEDNTNGVYAVVNKTLAVSTYSASVATNQGTANAANIKASAGNIRAILVGNTNAAARYLFCVNTAGVPVAASASFIMPILVPAGSQVVLGEDFFGSGIFFATGIGLAMMTTIAGGTLATAAETFWTIRYG